MSCHFVWWWETKSSCKSYTGKKRNKKGKGQVMHGKAIWKPGMAEIVKASRDFAPDPTRGVYSTPLNRQLQRPTCWSTLGYDLRSYNSIQKCFDKALAWLHTKNDNNITSQRQILTNSTPWTKKVRSIKGYKWECHFPR